MSNRNITKSATQDEHPESSRLKLMIALYKSELTYTQLAQETKLSNNTLIKRISDLRSAKIITESLHRSASTNKPVVYYALEKSWKAKLRKLEATIEQMYDVKEVCNSGFLLFKQKVMKAQTPEERDSYANEFTATMITSIVAIFSLGLLFESGNPLWDSFVATRALSVSRQIAWGHDMPRRFRNDMKRAIKNENQLTLKKLEELNRSIQRDLLNADAIE